MKAKTLQFFMLVLASLTIGPVHADTNCAALPSGLVAWWPGDGFAFDLAGTNHGTVQNEASYAQGLIDLAGRPSQQFFPRHEARLPTQTA